ncbi:ABC transporter substrate-binding protein [Paenibacillus sp. 1P07SE]|uniref:ABC transporter substrate-binding protein n=1 Tax=Paenibacillus sp. 1P07SE TaxID=3132209 RepID=UPI0039A76A96
MRPLLPFACLMLILLLSACGGQNNATPDNDPSPPQQQNTGNESEAAENNQAAGTSDMRTVTHMMGETEVPAEIGKIVVLSAAYADHLLTIGEKPYGINVEARYGGDYPAYLADQLAGVALVGSAEEPNLEAIAELDPDVILIESRTAETTYDQLGKIAPTIVLGTEWLAYEDDPASWTFDLLKIAQLYDKEDLAKERIAELEQKVAEAKQTVEALEDKKLAYLRVREKTVQIYAAAGHPMNTLLYHDLGFEPSALTPEDQRADLSLEVVPDLDAGLIFLEVDPNGLDNLQSIRESSLWSIVPAVATDQVHETDSFWLFKGWGAIGRAQIVEEILQSLS